MSTNSASMAAVNVVSALMKALRTKGVLSVEEIDHLLEQAQWPLDHSQDEDAPEASHLIGQMRVRLRSD